MAKHMVRIWVAGPRSWENEEPIAALLRKVVSNYGIARLLLLTGGAPGVDRLVEEEANKQGIHCVRVKACWPIGRKAGPVRNALIAEELEPKMLIALHYFPLDLTNHRGTQSAIEQARKRGIPVKILRFKPHTAMPSTATNESPMGNRARAQQGLPAKVKKPKRKRARTEA